MEKKQAIKVFFFIAQLLFNSLKYYEKSLTESIL